MTAETLARDILELAAVPAPTFAEEARLEWLEARLASAPGCRRRDTAGNLVWSWGEGPPVVALLAHVDTVFPAETPLRFREGHGRLVGPGIGDNAAAVVVALAAVEDLLASGPAAPGALVFTVGEEGLGNLRGAATACEELRPRAVVAVEGHGLEHVLVDAVGSVRFRLALDGPGGHSWADRGTPSAIHALAALVPGVLAHGTDETPVNVGTIEGGTSVNTIAAHAELVAEMRALDEPPLEAFATAVRGLEPPAGLTLAATEVGRRPAGRLDRSSPLLAAVRDVRAGLGLRDEVGAGSTDANAALGRGIPALTLGCTYGGAMHSDDEWIEVGPLELGFRQLSGVLGRLLGA